MLDTRDLLVAGVQAGVPGYSVNLLFFTYWYFSSGHLRFSGRWCPNLNLAKISLSLSRALRIRVSRPQTTEGPNLSLETEGDQSQRDGIRGGYSGQSPHNRSHGRVCGGALWTNSNSKSLNWAKFSFGEGGISGPTQIRSLSIWPSFHFGGYSGPTPIQSP